MLYNVVKYYNRYLKDALKKKSNCSHKYKRVQPHYHELQGLFTDMTITNIATFLYYIYRPGAKTLKPLTF